MGARKRWMPWEDALLRECERTEEAYTALARRLCRTLIAVKVRKAKQCPLGIKHERWTPEQDAMVRELYARRRALHREMEAAIGRPAHHVVARGEMLAWREAR